MNEKKQVEELLKALFEINILCLKARAKHIDKQIALAKISELASRAYVKNEHTLTGLPPKKDKTIEN